jgi:hypothetical protein
MCLTNSLFFLPRYLPRLCLLHAWIFLVDDNTTSPAFGSIFLLAGSPGSMSPSTSLGAGPALHGPIASSPPRAGHIVHGLVVSAASAQPTAPAS